MWNAQVTHIYAYCDSPIIFLLMSWALRALQKPGQLQHVRNRANIIRSGFFFYIPISLSTQQLKLLFFFLQSRVKSPKRVSLEHGFMEEANRLIPLGHELIKSKTWGQIRPGGRTRDECSPTVRSDKRMIKIKAGHRAPNTQLWWHREDNGQRERRKTLWGGLPFSLSSLLGYDTVHLAIPQREVICSPSSLLQSFRPTTDQFVTFKYVWQALVRKNSKDVSLWEHDVSCDNLAHHGPSTEHIIFCWFCTSTVIIIKEKFWYILTWHISHKCGAGATFCVYFRLDSDKHLKWFM